jgi:hypothetical protein
VVAFGEEELRGVDTSRWWATGRLELLQSIKSPANTEFIKVVGLRQGQEAAWR